MHKQKPLIPATATKVGRKDFYAQRQKPFVGQEVFLRNIQWGRNDEPHLRPATVTKVGRKYFYVDDKAFHVDTWVQHTDFSPDTEVYSSREEYAVRSELKQMWDYISGFFAKLSVRTIGVDKLRRIYAIIKEE